MEDKKKICPHCKMENAISTSFCSKCGTALPKPGDLPLILEGPDSDGSQKVGGEHAADTILASNAKTIKSSSVSEKQKIRIASTTSTHPNWAVRSEINQREQNEDSFQIYELPTPAFRENLKVFTIADGMGGHVYGERVSREVLRTVSHALFEQCVVVPTINASITPFALDTEKVTEVLESALQEANARVQQMVRSNKWGRAGSTIVIAVILGDTLIAANLGDSPLFLYRSRSKELKKITEDHTVAEVLVRKKIITPEMARYHEGRSRLEFYAGADSFPKQSPIRECGLIPGDLVLLCTDGISGCLTLEQLEKIVMSAPDDLEMLADRLLEASLEAEETDNQTLILWRYNPTRK